MAEMLTTKEVCKLYGVGFRTLEQWVRNGCPVAGRQKSGPKGGRPLNLFATGALASWALAHHKHAKGIIGTALKAATTPTTPVNPTPGRVEMESANPDLIRKQGIIGSLERARQQEMQLSIALARAHKDRQPADEIASLNAALTKLRTELRQLEMAALEYQRITGELCDYSEMKRLFSELASGTRERVMAVANQLVPTLRPYLKKPDEIGTVRDMIDDAIRHALTALPEELPEK